MSFTSTFSSLSKRGWQSPESGGQQTYSLIATQVGPSNTVGAIGEFVSISNQTFNNYNLCSINAGGGGNGRPGAWISTAFAGTRQTFTGSTNSFTFGEFVSMSSDGKYVVATGNGTNGSAANINIYFANANFSYSLQSTKSPLSGTYQLSDTAINDATTAIAVNRRTTDIVDIYNRANTTWLLGATLTPNVGNIPQDGFGKAIAFGDDNTIVVSAPGSTQPGTAFIYVNDSQVARIFPSISSVNDNFGTSVDMSSDANYLVVGSRNTNTIGAAFVFANVGNIWTEIATLSPASSNLTNESFGSSVAISNNGNTVIVSDPFAYITANNLNHRGSVYVFSKNGNTYEQTQHIRSPRGNVRSLFGEGLAMTNDGKRIIIGDQYANSPNGAVYLYQSFF